MKILTAIARTAARLCDAHDAQIYVVEGATMRLVAQHGSVRTTRRLGEPFPVSRGAVHGRAVLTRRAIHVRDLKTAVRTQYPELTPRQRATGTRTILAAPLLSGGAAVGVIMIRRVQVNPFTSRQIALLQTFADQAVITIENARLFAELQEKNRALTTAHAQVTEALEQQTATAAVLRVIGSSPTDAQPVFEAIVSSARRLLGGFGGAVYRVAGDEIHLAAYVSTSPTGDAALRSSFPRPLAVFSPPGEAIRGRAPVVLTDVDTDGWVPDDIRELIRKRGDRSGVWVPMMREGVALGAIGVTRSEPGSFGDEQIELLKTFADQAVIAIENVRLFTELEARNRALTESLEQQTASSEILRVISSSPTDVQPVFDAIAAAATTLCAAENAGVFLYDGTLIHFAAHHNWTAKDLEAIRRAFPRPPGAGTVTARAILTRAVVHTTIAAGDPAYEPRGFVDEGVRTILSVPMLRDGDPIGAISVTRREALRFTDRQIALLQTFADQAVIAIENVRLFKELGARNHDLTEALDKQTATSEILRVISGSHTDVQPVFDTIIQSAVRLLGGFSGVITQIVDDQLHLAALTSTNPSGDAAQKALWPKSLKQDGSLHGHVIRALAPQATTDVESDRSVPPSEVTVARERGYRSIVAVPLLRDGRAVGSMAVTRREPGPFADGQVALLQTFADQAVIAIENVRLFNETQEALERQTATAEILRVISSSPTDVQPVFDAIARSTVRLCDAARCAVWRPDGDLFRCVARCEMTSGGDVVSLSPEGVGALEADSLPGRVIHERQIVQVNDVPDNPAVPPKYREMARVGGYRSLMAVPMVHEGLAVGVITVVRPVAAEFSDLQIRLVKTFADQAVIAIENVRLFKELEARNRDLVEALDRQTATSEILRVISGSRADLEPVFDVIVRNAVRLCGASHGGVYRFDGELVHSVAHDGYTPEQLSQWRATWPKPVTAPSLACRAIETRTPVRASDFETAAELIGHSPETIANLRARGTRSVMAVPMFRRDEVIGAISLAHREVDAFADTHLELLKTFADQAVIAIENARLLKELEGRTHELTRSVGELRALGEVGQAISSTLDLETVLSTIVSRAVELSGLDGGVVFEYDERAEEFMQRAAAEGGILAQARRGTRYRKGEGVVGRTAITLEPVQVPDISVPGAYVGRMRENLIDSGIRALLAVPMVREDRLIGCLVVSRNRPGDFPAETIELLRTFATQSALAIQNARLFLEIADKSRQLEAASQHKSEFLANMSHELRTPLNAIIGFSEVLAQGMFGEINEKQSEYLHDILESGRHLLSLINDILDLSKIEAGRMELEATDFDLPQAIQNALTLVRERALRRGIALHHVIDDRVGGIRADERKVKQVLLNFLSNAIKFTPEGGRIDVRAAPADGLVEVSVTDTGVGIAPEDQETVFEEFRQVGTADKKAEGTGLGLTLSRKFIELHGGTIWVQSEVGRGSTFTFTLPVSPWPAR